MRLVIPVIYLMISATLMISCEEKDQVMTSPRGGYQIIKLDNGTSINLGPESKATYKLSSNQIMLEGEAILDVNPPNTLTVITSNGKMVAQPGEYRVHSRRTTMNVSVLNGKATTSNIDDTAPKELTSKMIAIYNGKNLAHSGEKELEQMSNDKYWVFNSASVRFILESLSAQYSMDFVEGDANLNKVFSGFVPRNDIQIALSIVLRSVGLEYEESDGKLYLKNSTY